MAAKWRAQQRKQRWEHSAVVLPCSLLESLSSLEQNCDASSLNAFAEELRWWNGLSNTYEQVDGAKRLVQSLQKLVSSSSRQILELALSAYVEVLFQEGSKPVHRTMLSPLAQMSSNDLQTLLCDAFYRCCVDYGAGGSKERRFALVSIGLSLVNMPKPGVLAKVVERSARLIALSSSLDVADALKRAHGGENPTPALMEDCQDAMSTLYYTIQKSPDKFSLADGVYEQVVCTSLDVLETSLMSRDCVVAAAVCFCAAAQVGTLHKDLGPVFAEALFPRSKLQLVQAAGSSSTLQTTIRTVRGTTLASEAARFTDFGTLCVLRGLLTSVPREVLNFCIGRTGDDSPKVEAWSLLYHGILPALCSSCESSFDSHFKFHAMTTLQICLQQAKASLMGNVTAAAFKDSGLSCSFEPFPATMTHRIMQIIWNNWEDPLNQTVKQVQMVFDLLADLQPYVVAGDGSTRSFLQRIASDLLSVGGHRKGRYVPLASLAVRVGAKTLLEMQPDLLFQTIQAMSDDGVCCAASSFLKVILERLREECWSSHGVAEGYTFFRRQWAPPMLAGLVAGNPRLRFNVQTYALPVGLEFDGDSVLSLLGFVLDGTSSRNIPPWDGLQGAVGMPGSLSQDQRVAAFISLIKVARSLAMMENEIKSSVNAEEMEFTVKGATLHAPVMLLELALTHMEDGLRVDAAEIICLNPKTAVMPSPLELHLLQLAMPLNMRCSSTAFRMKWTSFLKKFFARVRTSTDRQIKLNSKVDELVSDVDRLRKSVVTVSEMQKFMQWLVRLLVSSLYPSAPYERKYMAMEILSVMLDTWPTSKPFLKGKFCPYGKEIFSASYTVILIGAAVDSWDRLRESAFKILTRYPTPIPGLETQTAVDEVLNWGKVLACSPRVRESDAGALILRLLFRKYVCELGWAVQLHPHPAARKPPEAGNQLVQYFESLNDWLEAGVLEGEKDLLKACKHSLVHGVLLAYRYAVTELDWISDAVRSNVSGLRSAFERLLKLLLRVTSLTLWVVSADALNLQEKHFNGLEEDEPVDEVPDDDEDADDSGRLLAPAEQMIMVGCWLSMKEVSLLLGTIARAAPLPGCTYNARSKSLQSVEVEASELDDKPFIMLESHQLEAIGQHFLQVLLAMKHNGAIDKTRAGFIALCNRLLLSSDTSLSKLPEVWMQQLMTHTCAKGQSLDDLLRRSAGIPASFIALFLSEPDGAPRKLLPMGLNWLINNIKQFNAQAGTLNEPNEDVVPVVHAFNTLRVTFNDTNLSTDTSGFCAEGLIVSIQAFSSPYWQVRNSATLAFTALLHRTVGFLNVHKQATARRAITGFEFFHRYPALHPFLLQELQSATTQLEFDRKGLSQSRLHPSLAPVLVILSRLRPSIVNTRADDWLSPSAFMPYVMRCATKSNLKVRALASRALAPLVTPENLQNVLLELSCKLPDNKDSKPTYNAVHGVLLQLSSLLRNNCLELPDHEKQAEMVTKVFTKIRSCGWLGYARCFIVIEAFLQVLEELSEVARECNEDLRQIRLLLLDICAGSMDCRNAGVWDATQISLRATAARIYFSTVLESWRSSNLQNGVSEYKSFEDVRSVMSGETGNTNGFTASFRKASSDNMYEVRLATLKALKMLSSNDTAKLRSGSVGEVFSQTDASQLYDLLVERLYVETQPRCVKRILEAFLSWDLLTLETKKREDCLKLWNTLLHIYQDSKVAKTREYAVRCLGNCLQRIRASYKASISARQEESSDLVRQVFRVWTQLIDQHSAASQPVTMRRAIASAIVVSKCLEDARWLTDQTASSIHWYSEVILSVWSCSIKLLEDEDVSLRQELGLAMLDVMSSTAEGPLSGCDPAVPAQVEKVLESCLEFLRLQFRGCSFYYDFLAAWVIKAEKSKQGNMQDADLVRRLFDKELDNHHEEELLLVQLSCMHIKAFLQDERSSRDAFVLKWRSRFLQQAGACAQWCKELQQCTQWVGGITNHQDAFKSLYRTLLGLLVLAVPTQADDDAAGQILELTGALLQLPLSPLISNLLLLVLQDYERCTCADLGATSLEVSIGDSLCSDFEPFFLLK